MLLSRPSADWLIVGLGNPGRQYEGTRHNAGFRALQALAADLGCRIDRGKFQSLLGTCTWEGRRLVLLLPQTFMNLSGNAVGQAAGFTGFRRAGSWSCAMIFPWIRDGCGSGPAVPPGAITA